MATRRERLARRRKAVGFTQEALAERLDVDRSTVVRWECGGSEPQPWLRPKIARALQVSLEHLADLLMERAPTVPSRTAQRPVSVEEIGPGGEVDSISGLEFPQSLAAAVRIASGYWSAMHRRHFLTRTGVVVASYTTPALRWATQPRDANAASGPHDGGRHVGHADIAELAAVADDARRWDRRYGGGNWRASAVISCLREHATPLLRGTFSDETGRQLFGATAELSRVAGWLAFDSGDHRAAQSHYIQSLRLARAAGDIALGGYVLTCMSMQASLLDAHDQAIDLISTAVHTGRGYATPRVLAFFKAIEARVHARAQDGRAADAALATAEQLLDTAESRPTGDDPPWIDFVDRQRLAADAIEVQRDLCRPDAALRWSAQGHMGADEFVRANALRDTILGCVHLQGPDPDLDTALHHGHKSIDALVSVKSARALRYIDELLTHTRRWGSEPRVRDFVHRVDVELRGRS